MTPTLSRASPESLAALGRDEALALTWPQFARIWPGAASPARDQPNRRSGTRSVSSLPQGGQSPSSFRKPLPPPSWSFAMPRSRSTRTESASHSSGPLTGCHGARRGTYRIVYRIDQDQPRCRTSSILTIARRSTTARNGDLGIRMGWLIRPGSHIDHR